MQKTDCCVIQINQPNFFIFSDYFLQEKYSFFLYGPLKDDELTHDIRNLLSGKIVMLGFNKEQDELPFDHPIIPLYIWAKENLLHKD